MCGGLLCAEMRAISAVTFCDFSPRNIRRELVVLWFGALGD